MVREVGTKRTITKMLWAFAEPLPMSKFMEEEAKERGARYAVCPKIWKIEVVIDPTLGRDGFFPRGFVNFYVLVDKQVSWPLERWLFDKQVSSDGCSNLHSHVAVQHKRFKVSFKSVKNKNDTTTAIDLCIDLFDKFGIEVWTGPEISQHTQVLDSYSDSDGCEWIDFGQKRWRDRLKQRQRAAT